MSEGHATIAWARMNFGEEGARALVGGLIAPREKTLVQPAARWLLSGDHLSLRMSYSFALSLALREEDDGKRTGSVTETDNSARSRKIKKAVIYFAIPHTERDHVAHSGGTLIMLSEEDGRMLSPSAVMVRHAGIEPTWARLSLGRSRSLKRKANRKRREARLKHSQCEHSLSAASVWDFPKRDTHSAWVSSACRGFPQVLQ